MVDFTDTEDQYQDDSDELFEHHRIVVDPGQSLIRIDKFLSDRLPNVSRSRIQSGIKDSFVKVNNGDVKSNYKVRPDDIITVSLPQPPRDKDVIPENILLNIVYEDNAFLVVNKPAGMVVHPAGGNWSGTLVNALLWHCKDLKDGFALSESRPGIVHGDARAVRGTPLLRGACG